MDNPWEVLPRKCRALMSAQITAWALVERLGTVRALTSLGMWCDTWLGTARALIEITAGALHERCLTSEITADPSRSRANYSPNALDPCWRAQDTLQMH